MAPLSLKIVQDNGAVTRKVKLDPSMTVREATAIVKEKALLPPDAKEYGLFLRSLDNNLAGIWLEDHRQLSHYMLRDGDVVDYMCKFRHLRLKMLDNSVKTIQVDQSKLVSDLMISICSKLGITNQEEYGLCFDTEEELVDAKDSKTSNTGTLTLKKKSALKDRDFKLEQLSKKLKTDDNVEWLDAHQSLAEACTDSRRTLLLKRRLFYSDRNVDSRDPVQLNLLYLQARDNILLCRHPVTEAQAADCKVRWINIRDVHRRILRKSIGNEAYRPKRAYKYDKPLEFMRQFYKEVATAPSMQNEDDSDNDDTDKISESWAAVGLDYENNLESDERDSKPLKKRKRTLKAVRNSSDFEEAEISSATIVDRSEELDSSDPVDSFLLNIRSTLKKLTPYHLNLAKSKIFQIVQRHDLEQIVTRQPGETDSISTVNLSDEPPLYYQA